jgi:hypothetical protein
MSRPINMKVLVMSCGKLISCLSLSNCNVICKQFRHLRRSSQISTRGHRAKPFFSRSCPSDLRIMTCDGIASLITMKIAIGRSLLAFLAAVGNLEDEKKNEALRRGEWSRGGCLRNCLRSSFPACQTLQVLSSNSFCRQRSSVLCKLSSLESLIRF